MLANSVFSLLLFGISGLLLDSHRRARSRLLAVDTLDEAAERFAHAQYRRRMLASATIGLVAAGIAVRPLVPPRPLPMTAYLLILVTCCGWILLLALVDVLATTNYYRRLRGKHQAAEIKLARELQAARDKQNQT